MSSRGPDAEGLWQGDGVVLGHRRLAILDLDPRSNQPMVRRDGRYTIVFNGEIYNFRELRRELESEGEAFHTTSDTEVILALFARYGERMLPRLRGMFAFAIWDTRNRELFMARDPYGIKPLYYTETKDGVLFASQVKALLASGLTSTEIEPAGLAGFYLWGNVPEPWTLFKGVYALPSGSWMRVRSGAAEKPVIWHDIRKEWQESNNHSLPAAEVHEQVRQAVTASVQAHLVSDVPVSVLLSGGIDSGTIAGLTSQLGSKVEGITIAFGEFSALPEDEVPDASSIASHYGLVHTVRRVDRSEFEEELPRFFDAMDQPTIDGMNTWLASKAVAERGYKVVLSGTGGDELFYGYALAHEVPRRARLGRFITAFPGVRPMLKSAFSLAGGRWHPKLKGVPEFMGSIEGEYFLRRALFLPEELSMLMDPEEAREGVARLSGWPPAVANTNAVNPEGAVSVLDSTLYLRNQLLRDSDWASMAHSLELRTPLVDAALLGALKSIHTHFALGSGKRMLAQSPVEPLPESIINRPKTGFSVPMTQWLSSNFDGLDWSKSPLLAPSRTPWARRWASVVVKQYLASLVSVPPSLRKPQ